MEEEFENNDSLVNNFQEDINNSPDDFKQELMQNTEEENELEEDIFQYTPNIREIAKKDFSKYINKQSMLNNNDKNDFINNLNFKYSNDININEDISGISLLKELEEQWNNIEKQKNNNFINKNKNDESTYSNSKSNNNNIDKFKYIIDMIELKKNKFISNTEKAKKERNDDNEIEEYFLGKLKEMEEYKITDEDLRKKIEIRQQEKNNEDADEEKENNNEVNDDSNNYNEEIDNNDNYNNINENTFNKKQYLINMQNKNKFPELEDLVYETPARTNNYDKNIISLDKNKYKSDYEIENEDNVNIGNISRPENNIMSGKLFNKMKNLYKEINGNNNEIQLENNNLNKKNKSNEGGVLGINNINIKDNKYEENIILKNLRNNNNINNDNGNINDANKSISLNFNFINKNKNSPNLNMQRYEQNRYNKNNDIRNTPDNRLIKPKENNIIFKDKDRMTLTGLQENFDDILKKVKSSHNKQNKNNFILFNKQNNSEEYFEEKEEFNKYFEDLSKEAKLNLQKNKNLKDHYTKGKFNKENRILKKIEENSLLFNDYMNDVNQNKNKFKQRILELNNNLNNIRKNNDINDTIPNKHTNTNNINTYNRNMRQYNIFSNNNYNDNNY